MNIEKIDEPISVLAMFSGGSAEPVRFRWNGRDYEVDAVNGKWTDRQGAACRLHYSLQIGGETYYVHFDSGQLQWRLDQIIAD